MVTKPKEPLKLKLTLGRNYSGDNDRNASTANGDSSGRGTGGGTALTINMGANVSAKLVDDNKTSGTEEQRAKRKRSCTYDYYTIIFTI